MKDYMIMFANEDFRPDLNPRGNGYLLLKSTKKPRYTNPITGANEPTIPFEGGKYEIVAHSKQRAELEGVAWKSDGERPEQNTY